MIMPDASDCPSLGIVLLMMMMGNVISLLVSSGCSLWSEEFKCTNGLNVKSHGVLLFPSFSPGILIQNQYINKSSHMLHYVMEKQKCRNSLGYGCSCPVEKGCTTHLELAFLLKLAEGHCLHRLLNRPDI